MARYAKTENGEFITDNETGAIIPKDNLNLQYREYLEWCKTNTVEEYVKPLNEKIIDINSKANEDIIAIAPEYKQRNYIARSVELLNKKIDGSLTVEEQAEMDQLQSVWDQIKAIRDQSDDDIAAL